MRGTNRSFNIVALTVIFLASTACGQQVVATADSPAGFVDGECQPTMPTEEFAPPEPYASSRQSAGLIWYGSDDLWTALSLDGNHGGRKSVWWSVNFPGGAVESQPAISVTWRQLDGDTVHTHDNDGTNAYTAEDGWFMISGIDPPDPGCWEVTATYKGASLSYVYEKA